MNCTSIIIKKYKIVSMSFISVTNRPTLGQGFHVQMGHVFLLSIQQIMC